MKKKTEHTDTDARERSLDTSLPGREEEVIVNKDEAGQHKSKEGSKVNERLEERRSKEGLQDNSNTENDN